MPHIFSTRKGRKLADKIKRRDLYTCQMCGRIVTPGRDAIGSAAVDHIIPTSLAPELAWDEGNLWTVCKGCHDGPCQRIERQHTTGPDIAKAKRSWGKSMWDRLRMGLDC